MPRVLHTVLLLHSPSAKPHLDVGVGGPRGPERGGARAARGLVMQHLRDTVTLGWEGLGAVLPVLCPLLSSRPPLSASR